MNSPDEHLALRSESTDPRAIRTRNALVGAAIEFLRKYPASKMSVSQVVKDAGVSRQVFYQHFADLNALIYTAGTVVLGGPYERFAENFQKAEDFEAAVKMLTSNLSPDYSVIMNLVDSPVHAQLDNYVFEIMLPTLHTEVASYMERLGYEHSEETVELLARFLIAGGQQVLENGVREGAREEELAREVSKVGEILLRWGHAKG